MRLQKQWVEAHYTQALRQLPETVIRQTGQKTAILTHHKPDIVV